MLNSNLRVNTQTPATQTPDTSPTGQQPAPLSRSPSQSQLSENLAPRTNANASPTSPRPRLSLQDLTGGRTSPTPRSPQATTTSTTPTATSPNTTTVSPTTATTAPPAKLVVNDPPGGNDKQWFSDPSGKMGWLQARDNGKAEAVRREVATIKTLADLGFPVAQIIDRPPPESITSNGADKPVQTTGGGVWLATVDKVAQKKPKMLGHPTAGGMYTNGLLRDLKKEEVNLPNLAQNLAKLLQPVDPKNPEFTRADQLCQHVGEVDIAFTKDGRITLLDVAPADGGQVAAQDDLGVAHIKAGLQNLLTAVNKAAAAQAAAPTTTLS